jgi:hypothetical protein
VLVAREALDKLVEFGRESGATDDTAINASQLVVQKRHVAGGQRDHRATWEDFTANNLLMGMYEELRERDTPEVERINSLTAQYLLDEGDDLGALAAADEMIHVAETIGSDAWNEDDLLHEGHIVRGTIFLRRGDVQAAASELLAAAASPDTSGRPDPSDRIVGITRARLTSRPEQNRVDPRYSFQVTSQSRPSSPCSRLARSRVKAS